MERYRNLRFSDCTTSFHTKYDPAHAPSESPTKTNTPRTMWNGLWTYERHVINTSIYIQIYICFTKEAKNGCEWSRHITSNTSPSGRRVVHGTHYRTSEREREKAFIGFIVNSFMCGTTVRPIPLMVYLFKSNIYRILHSNYGTKRRLRQKDSADQNKKWQGGAQAMMRFTKRVECSASFVQRFNGPVLAQHPCSAPTPNMNKQAPNITRSFTLKYMRSAMSSVSVFFVYILYVLLVWGVT